MTTPLIDYTDADPIISGKVGFRVCNAHARFDNFSVTENDDTGTGNITLPAEAGEVQLFPNPVSEQLTVRNLAAYSSLTAFRADGREVYRTALSGESCIINTAGFDPGVYILRLRGEAGERTRRFIKE
jgi:hypothetical protein